MTARRLIEATFPLMRDLFGSISEARLIEKTGNQMFLTVKT